MIRERCRGLRFGGKRVRSVAMKHLVQVLLGFFVHLGGPGLLAVGILDSSFLFAPLGNDLLVVALTSQKREVGPMLYYAAMSAIGSMLGCALVDVVMRRAGESGLERHLSRRRMAYVKAKVEKDAAVALVLASIAPPPFPFTPFIMAASALQYPRKKLFSIVGAARMARFTGLGVLALYFGRSILHWVENPALEVTVIALIVLAVVGSSISVIGWIKRSRKPAAA